MITNPASISLVTPCKRCGAPVAIQNAVAWRFIRIDGITCKDCLNTPKYSKAEHAEYVQSDHWKAFREKAFQYYGRKCYLCNTTDGIIDLHHNTYERKGHELLSDVIPLCRKHHEQYEANK